MARYNSDSLFGAFPVVAMFCAVGAWLFGSGFGTVAATWLALSTGYAVAGALGRRGRRRL